MKFFKLCLNFEHAREIARLNGELDWVRVKAQDLADQLVEKETKLHEIMEWLLKVNGAPSMYHEDAPKAEAKAPRPFAGARTARDFQRIADQLENEAMFNKGQS